MLSIKDIGLNSGALVGIIGLSELIKKLDPKDKLKRFYPLLPVALGLIAGAIITTLDGFTFTQFLLNSFIYGGVSSLAYNLIKKTFMNVNSSNQPVQPAGDK
jgi:ABC-type xylose transport system permease subunit